MTTELLMVTVPLEGSFTGKVMEEVPSLVLCVAAAAEPEHDLDLVLDGSDPKLPLDNLRINPL